MSSSNSQSTQLNRYSGSTFLAGQNYTTFTPNVTCEQALAETEIGQSKWKEDSDESQNVTLEHIQKLEEELALRSQEIQVFWLILTNIRQ